MIVDLKQSLSCLSGAMDDSFGKLESLIQVIDLK